MLLDTAESLLVLEFGEASQVSYTGALGQGMVFAKGDGGWRLRGVRLEHNNNG